MAMKTAAVRPWHSSYRSRVATLWLLCSGFLAAACATDDPRPTPGQAGAEDEGAGGTAATGQTGATGGSGTVVGGKLNLGDSSNEPDSGGAPTTVSPDDACATSTDNATPLPTILQLVVDTSGSMDWPPGWRPSSPDDSKPAGATKWEITRDALLTAVESLSPDVALGVNFYPNVQQQGSTCLLNEAAVPLRRLGAAGSAARGRWQDAIGGVDPVGATPTHGAYRFGLTQLVATDLPGTKFVLLITDGTPTCTVDCVCTEDDLPVDSAPLLEEAATALADDIRTFVIGSPGSEATRELLSQLAVVGGTPDAGCSPSGPHYCHFDMTSAPDLASGLAEALETIATQLRSCEYPIPAPPDGQALDLDRVNVLYTPPGGTAVTIARDPSSTSCQEGWQYSSEADRIVLCGRACEQVRTDATGTVELLFGCETVTAKPK
jgi:hypothetical protein